MLTKGMASSQIPSIQMLNNLMTKKNIFVEVSGQWTNHNYMLKEKIESAEHTNLPSEKYPKQAVICCKSTARTLESHTKKKKQNSTIWGSITKQPTTVSSSEWNCAPVMVY